jgi:hypothetical protein
MRALEVSLCGGADWGLGFETLGSIVEIKRVVTRRE